MLVPNEACFSYLQTYPKKNTHPKFCIPTLNILNSSQNVQQLFKVSIQIRINFE